MTPCPSSRCGCPCRRTRRSPCPLFLPSHPAATRFRSSVGARYLSSPISRWSTSAMASTVSRPMRSLSSSGPIGWLRPSFAPVSMSSGRADALLQREARLAEHRDEDAVHEEAGRVLARRRRLAHLLGERARSASYVSSLVCTARTISTSFMSGGGFMKCIPMTRSGRDVAAASLRERDATTCCSRATCPAGAPRRIFLKSATLSSRFSVAASTTKSHARKSSGDARRAGCARGARSPRPAVILPFSTCLPRRRRSSSCRLSASSSEASTRTTSKPGRGRDLRDAAAHLPGAEDADGLDRRRDVPCSRRSRWGSAARHTTLCGSRSRCRCSSVSAGCARADAPTSGRSRSCGSTGTRRRSRSLRKRPRASTRTTCRRGGCSCACSASRATCRARAREAEELARTSGPSDPTPYIELGHALELAHRYDEALEAYDAAASAAPASPAGPREGGMRCARWGEAEEAQPAARGGRAPGRERRRDVARARARAPSPRRLRPAPSRRTARAPRPTRRRPSAGWGSRRWPSCAATRRGRSRRTTRCWRCGPASPPASSAAPGRSRSSGARTTRARSTTPRSSARPPRSVARQRAPRSGGGRREGERVVDGHEAAGGLGEGQLPERALDARHDALSRSVEPASLTVPAAPVGSMTKRVRTVAGQARDPCGGRSRSRGATRPKFCRTMRRTTSGGQAAAR